jgi:hypothetical protein
MDTTRTARPYPKRRARPEQARLPLIHAIVYKMFSCARALRGIVSSLQMHKCGSKIHARVSKYLDKHVFPTGADHALAAAECAIVTAAFCDAATDEHGALWSWSYGSVDWIDDMAKVFARAAPQSDAVREVFAMAIDSFEAHDLQFGKVLGVIDARRGGATTEAAAALAA